MGLQKGLVEFEVDATQLQRIELKLKDMKSKAPQALKNAVNATARTAKKDLVSRAKEVYAVKTPRFNSSIKQKNATKSTMTAILNVSGEVNPLYTYFKGKENSGAAAARGKVLKSGSMKYLQKENLKAFIATFESGHTTIVQRDPPKQYKKGLKKRLQKSPYGDTTKIKELYGPSVPKMIGNEAKVYGYLKPNIQENLQKNIHKQIDKILGGR